MNILVKTHLNMFVNTHINIHVNMHVNLLVNMHMKILDNPLVVVLWFLLWMLDVPLAEGWTCYFVCLLLHVLGWTARRKPIHMASCTAIIQSA